VLDPLHSPIYSEIRGKLGHWVYARNPSGPLARPRPGKRKMSSALQTAQRQIFKVVIPRWSSVLTDAQRAAWCAFTQDYPRQDQLGQRYVPSGFNRFTQANVVSYALAGTFINDPPQDLQVSQPTLVIVVALAASPLAVKLSINSPLKSGEYWILSATDPRNAGRIAPGQIWRPLASANTALPQTVDASAAYAASFKPLTSGKRVFFSLRIANTTNGAESVAITTSATAA
jgi:hypothetical protein